MHDYEDQSENWELVIDGVLEIASGLLEITQETVAAWKHA